MHIAIIGAGTVGTTLGRGWLEAGHEVTFGARDPDDESADGLREMGAAVASNAAAVEASDVVVFALPWGAVEPVARSIEDFDDRVLVDVTNPLADGLELAVGHTSSGAEMLQGWAPTARVVKCFNTTGAENMAGPTIGDRAVTMPLCGDDDEARTTTARLAADLGFDALDVGGLEYARLLEPMAMLWIHLALRRGEGRDIGWALLRR